MLRPRSACNGSAVNSGSISCAIEAVSSLGRARACRCSVVREDLRGRGGRPPVDRCRRRSATTLRSATIRSISAIGSLTMPGLPRQCTSQKPITARLRCSSAPARSGSAEPGRPSRTSRAVRTARARPGSRRRSGRPPSPARCRPARRRLQSSRAPLRSAAPRVDGRRLRRGSSRGRACPGSTRPRSPGRHPSVLASWIARVPTPPAAAWTTTVSPAARCALVRSRCQAVRPCTISASACPSVTSSGRAKVRSGNVSAFSAYPPVPTSDATRRPSAVSADDLAARDHRQLGRGQVGVLDLVGVGVVDARAA